MQQNVEEEKNQLNSEFTFEIFYNIQYTKLIIIIT